MNLKNSIICLTFLLFSFQLFAKSEPLKILVFSKTQTFRHKSIPKGIETFEKLASQNNWNISHTEDAMAFDNTIFKYDVLVFLNTTGDILNESQQDVLKAYFARGKGFVGVHSASDTELQWTWYTDMIGAEFSKHPKIQKAKLNTSRNYQAFFGSDYKTRETEDEWYNFKAAVKPNVNVLTYLDETSYNGGEMKGDHPITWYHHFDGGRVFYTGLGHRDEQYDNPTFLNELITGVKWAGGLVNDPAPAVKKLTNLLTNNLNDNWAVFVGAPHATVLGLPNVDPKSNGKNSEALGLNNDPKQVFKLEKQGDENVLHISGEIYGALTSKLEYQNYHLKLQFKWGEKLWEPRLKDPKDNGILYHAIGPYRTFWNVWMQSHEFQVQRHDMGDYFALAGTKATIALAPIDDNKMIYKKGATKADISGKLKAPYNTAKRGFDNENPEGEWNTLELYCIGDKSVHVVNGKVVMYLENLMQFNKDGVFVPITKGLIQIQSEAAEAYYKNIQIETITKLPKNIIKQL